MPESTPAAGSRAVFLSYAREDADAVRRIVEALRSAGADVWFDHDEFRGGEAWEQKIKKQIRECALFLAVVSQTTQARREGYFRREWELAVERTRELPQGASFLLPLAIDQAHEMNAFVPEEFMAVQWTRLPGGLPSTEFVAHVRRLAAAARGSAPPMSGKNSAPAPPPAPAASGATTRRSQAAAVVAAPPLRPERKPFSPAMIVAAVVLVSVLAGVAVALWKSAAGPKAF